MSLPLLLNSVINHKRFTIQIKFLGETVFKLVALCALEININRHKLIILTYGCSFALVLQECMNSWRKLHFSFIPSPSFNNVRDGTEEMLSGLCSTFIIGKMLPVSKTVKTNNLIIITQQEPVSVMHSSFYITRWQWNFSKCWSII